MNKAFTEHLKRLSRLDIKGFLDENEKNSERWKTLLDDCQQPLLVEPNYSRAALWVAIVGVMLVGLTLGYMVYSDHFTDTLTADSIPTISIEEE